MAEGPFDHLELSAGDNSLPDDVQAALWDIHFRRIEIGPVSGAPARTYAVRLDGAHTLCSDDASVPGPLRVLLDYIAEHGVTPPLLDYIRDQNRRAERVAGIERPSPPPGIAPAETLDREVAARVTLGPAVPPGPSALAKLARAAAAIVGGLLWLFYQFYLSGQSPSERERIERADRQRQEAARAKAAHNYW